MVSDSDDDDLEVAPLPHRSRSGNPASSVIGAASSSAAAASSSSGGGVDSRTVIDLVSDDSSNSSDDQPRGHRRRDWTPRPQPPVVRSPLPPPLHHAHPDLLRQHQRHFAHMREREREQHHHDINSRMDHFRRMRESFHRRAEEHHHEYIHRRTEEHLRQARERLRQAQAMIDDINRRTGRVAEGMAARDQTAPRRRDVLGFPEAHHGTYAEARAQLIATLERMQSYQFMGMARRTTPDDVIAAIPTFKVPSKGGAAASSSSSEEEDCCAICLDGYEPGQSVSKLKCNHKYHTGCINKWLKEDTVCCTCRQDVTR